MLDTLYSSTKDKDFNIPLSFDVKFKRMFADEVNIHKLETLVSILFNIPYEDIKGNIVILNNEKLTNFKKNKKGAMDLYFKLTLLNGSAKIDIEVSNIVLPKSILNRNIYFMSYLSSTQLRSNDDYSLLLPSITICLDKGIKDVIENDIINIYELRDKYSNKLTDKLQFWHINIEKCYKIWYSNNINKYEKEEQNIIMLGALLNINNLNEFSKCLGGMNMSEEIKEEIEKTNKALNEYEDIMSWYDYDKDQEAIRKGELTEAKNEGMKEGIEQGMKEKNIENVKNFKKLGVDISIISQATGLTIEEINEI